MRSLGYTTTEGNSVKLLKSGNDKFVDMFEAVRNAKKFIHLEYFNFRNDSIANLLFALLTEKANEGVEVRAMYDAFGNWSNNQPISRHQHDSIAATGISLVKFRPLTFPWVNKVFPRDHRKIVVIDGEIAYTGGMNVADYYIDGIEGIGPWRDMHMHIEGEAVNGLHQIFAQMWEKSTGEKIEGEKYFPIPRHAGDAKIMVVERTPNKRNKAIRQLYISMLDNAQHSVRIINPYFVPTRKVRRAIARTIDRGIDVEIMISEKGDIPLTPDASHYVGYQYARRGGKVYIFGGGFHHTKVMMVDSLFCTVGSSNLDARSLRFDYEINTLILDQPTTGELLDMFEEDKKSSVLLTTEWYKKKTKWKRFVGWFGNFLKAWL